MEPSKKKMRMTVESDSKPGSEYTFSGDSVTPLLKLPQLAQIEVIRSMTPSEQYLLSKCSQRSRRAVKNSNNKKPREVWVHFHRDDVIETPKSLILQLYYYLRIGGSNMFIHESGVKFSPEEHEYICDLFNACSELYASFVGSTPYLKDFTINRLIKRSNLLEWKYNHQVIDQYSKLHPDQDLVLFDGPYINSVREGHSFLGSKNLTVSSTKDHCAFNILSVFGGEHLLMEDVEISTYFVQAFVNKWKRQKDDRLKSVILQLRSESVIGDLGYDKFTGRNEQFQYDSLIKEYYQFPNGIFNFSNGYDVRRKTDGKSATITIFRDYFMFLVW